MGRGPLNTNGRSLEDVTDCDEVFVMDAGRLVERGAPAELLARPAGWFAALAAQLGPARHAAIVAAAGPAGGGKQ